jgi:putative aldouronate transport system permease protein
MVVEATMDLGSTMANAMRDANMQVHGRSLQMATVTIATIPILLVYPFLQKYFTKGIMLGAIKA